MEATYLEDAKKITGDYAAYARDASGLGNVVGAIFVFVGASLPQSELAHWWARLLIGSTPFWWVLVKEQLRSRYYRQFGYVEPKTGIGERMYSILIVSFAGCASLLSIPALIAGGTKLTPALVISVCVLLAIPFVAYRYMRGKYEFVTGLFLVLQAASALSTGTPFAFLRAFLLLPAVIVAVIMLIAGIQQHRQFLALKKTLTYGFGGSDDRS